MENVPGISGFPGGRAFGRACRSYAWFFATLCAPMLVMLNYLDLSGMIMIMAMDCASMFATGLTAAGFWHGSASTLALGRDSASERNV
ncbi:MAG: hypothetical protein M1420_05345 [Actinobacteria bacterium]|nr:hypothetical protein [Actinomycetota bacterium]